MDRHTLSRIVTGMVMHRRHQPVDNRFVYPVFFVLLNLNELDRLGSWLFGINRSRPLAFHFKDHGDGRDPRHWIEGVLQQHGIPMPEGPIWLQTFPRVLGYLFNPVSFWYCTANHGSVRAIVAEVNNTFGERHCYVLQPGAEGGFRNLTSQKRLFVSPFYPESGEYRFSFNHDFLQPTVSIDYFDEGELQLNTAIWGKSRRLTTSAALQALIRQPLLTFGIISKIHWQALRLWLKQVPLFDRTTPSAEEAPR